MNAQLLQSSILGPQLNLTAAGKADLEDGPHNERAQIRDEAVDALAAAALEGHHHHLGPLRQQQLGGCLHDNARVCRTMAAVLSTQGTP